MRGKALVLDANILIRAALGQRVRRILEAHADSISFFVPETAYAEAEEHLAGLVSKRGGDPAKALVSLRSMAALGTVVGQDLYEDFEAEARKRLGARDPDDWPILAAALALGCPIWTEDNDLLWLWRRDLDVRQHRQLPHALTLTLRSGLPIVYWLLRHPYSPSHRPKPGAGALDRPDASRVRRRQYRLPQV